MRHNHWCTKMKKITLPHREWLGLAGIGFLAAFVFFGHLRFKDVVSPAGSVMVCDKFRFFGKRVWEHHSSMMLCPNPMNFGPDGPP